MDGWRGRGESGRGSAEASRKVGMLNVSEKAFRRWYDEMEAGSELRLR